MKPGKWLAFLVVTAMAAGCLWGPLAGGQLGSGARELADGGRWPTLVVEIDHPPGYAPGSDALGDFKSIIASATGRATSDVPVVLDAAIASEPNRRYATQDLRDLERQHRTHRTQGGTAALYVLYLAGGSTSDSDESQVLGVAYGATSVALFKGNINAHSSDSLLSSKPRTQYVERAVLIHETGHAMGLVNIGASMTKAREDASHPGHSTNQQSVMYWAVETSGGLVSLLNRGSDIPYRFDADDLNDLKALREE